VALTIRRVLEEPGMEGFRVDFAHEFLETLRAFLYGPKKRTGKDLAEYHDETLEVGTPSLSCNFEMPL
jgi:hypothetical protein